MKRAPIWKWMYAVVVVFIVGCAHPPEDVVEEQTETTDNIQNEPIEQSVEEPIIVEIEEEEADEMTTTDLYMMATAVGSVTVLVNSEFPLPNGFVPSDLVYPDVPFLIEEKVERRMMQREAAEALEKLFEKAAADGVKLLGVSGYRSHERQTELFNYYVERDGEEVARTYSAFPGTSEHETGLAIDVTGGDGSCAAQSCFGDTAEAKWLEENVAEYGFIIRYPKGKEEITGYKYEPWHLRYVGVHLAKEVTELGLTLEEYYQVIPVSSEKK